MALSSLWKHRKFRRLEASIGSRCMAVGILECLWSVGYETGNDLIGTSEEIETVCDWKGKGRKRGRLTSLLHEIGWIDLTPDGYRIHDFYDHCPRYVKRRIERRSMDGQRTAGDRPATGQRTAGDRQYPTQPNRNPTQPNQPPTPGERASGFEDFWKTYPRKVGREAALRAWLSKVVNGDADRIMAALAWQVASAEWKRDGGRYVPKPENYLWESRWLDERPRDAFLDADDEEVIP